MSEKVKLDYDQAASMLPEGDCIHTFIQVGPAICGADWEREKVLELLRTGRPELSGEIATSMQHGIVAWRGDEPVFIATAGDAG